MLTRLSLKLFFGGVCQAVSAITQKICNQFWFWPKVKKHIFLDISPGLIDIDVQLVSLFTNPGVHHKARTSWLCGLCVTHRVAPMCEVFGAKWPWAKKTTVILLIPQKVDTWAQWKNVTLKSKHLLLGSVCCTFFAWHLINFRHESSHKFDVIRWPGVSLQAQRRKRWSNSKLGPKHQRKGRMFMWRKRHPRE